MLKVTGLQIGSPGALRRQPFTTHDLSVTFSSRFTVEALRKNDQGFGPGQQRGPLSSAGRPTLLDLRPKLTKHQSPTGEQEAGQGNRSSTEGLSAQGLPLGWTGYGRGRLCL